MDMPHCLLSANITRDRGLSNDWQGRWQDWYPKTVFEADFRQEH